MRRDQMLIVALILKPGRGGICDRKQREPMLFTKSCLGVTGKTRLFQLCCPLFFFSFRQAFEPEQPNPGGEERAVFLYLVNICI